MWPHNTFPPDYRDVLRGDGLHGHPHQALARLPPLRHLRLPDGDRHDEPAQRPRSQRHTQDSEGGGETVVDCSRL